MRRPWVIVVVAFAVVLTVGGLALAMPGVLDTPNKDESAVDVIEASELPAAGHESDLPEVEAPHGDTPTEVKPEAPPAEDKIPETDVPQDDWLEDEPKDEPKDEAPVFDTVPPQLTITWPEDGEHVGDHKIRFVGVTDPGVAVFAGKYEADVDIEGNWGIVLILEPGGNLASFRAVGIDDAVSEASVKVFYDAPQEPSEDKPKEDEKPKEEESPSWEFWAKQVYGSCGENPPYDVFHGETAPNAAVMVSSPYGSGSTTAGEKGGWELKVTFWEAPLNEPFFVTVASEGHSKQFEFVHYGEPDAGHEEGAAEK